MSIKLSKYFISEENISCVMTSLTISKYVTCKWKVKVNWLKIDKNMIISLGKDQKWSFPLLNNIGKSAGN